MLMTQAKAEFNPIFKGFNKCTKRYRLAKGSAGSGKSVNIAQDFILRLGDMRYKGANLLVVRKIEGSNRDSTFAELTGAIFRIYGELAHLYWDMKTNPLEITNKATGNQIIFRGVQDARQREKVKSITVKQGKLTWIWIEEATELFESDVDTLDDRLRGDLSGVNVNLYYQITFSFNPVSATHWIKAKYFDINHPDVYTHQSTYLDNRFIDDAYHRRMLMRKERDPEGYRVYGLGEWGETGGLILTNYIVESFDVSHSRFSYMVNAQDFGYNHANALGEIGFKDGEMYVCRELYVFEKDTGEIIELANRAGFQKNIPMHCDSAEPDRIKMWQKAGYKRARGVKKEPGSVKAQIDYLKQMPTIHIHESCINTYKEIQQWKWRKDEKTGLYLDEPAGFMDDAMAMLRYSIEDIRRNSKAKVKSKSKYGFR